jgi:FtsP/CotA-like multicopper oxidase with cupredoxin domain
MLTASRSSLRWWALILLVGIGFAVTLVTAGSPQVNPPPLFTCRAPANPNPSGFSLPEVRQSLGGLLRTTLTACISTIEMLDQRPATPVPVQFYPPTFEAAITAPTLSVKPGDKLSLLMINSLPANQSTRAGAFPHAENSINLHTHGLTVSPLGISDNIFRQMDPGTAHLAEINIPQTHPSGTYWYHVHKHGSATYQFLGGMAGFLIINGGPGTLDTVPEVAAAKDVPMAFQIVRSLNNGSVVFVNEKAEQFGTFPFPPSPGGFDPPGPTLAQQGVWSTYGLDGQQQPDGQLSRFSYTTNGVNNPTLTMQPGEVQRWRLLNATDSENFQLVLVSEANPQQGPGLNVVAMDGITVPKTYHLAATMPIVPPPWTGTVAADALVIGPGQRMDVMVKAPAIPGTYLLRTIDPNSSLIRASVSPYRDSSFPNGIDPAWRMSRRSFDFPVPCPGGQQAPGTCDPPTLNYPITLATVVVAGSPLNMNLPPDPLPVPTGLPSIATMQNRVPDKVRQIGFELCGGVAGTQTSNMGMGPTFGPFKPFVNPPACGWYFAKYDATYWGGTPFTTLLMMRDLDDVGQPTHDPNMPLANFKKEGLFDHLQPLFPDMIAGNYEEWTIYNRSFSDHPWHLHQNHVLITKINGVTLPLPEWHDTLLVLPPIVPTGRPLPRELPRELPWDLEVKDEAGPGLADQPRSPRQHPWAPTTLTLPVGAAEEHSCRLGARLGDSRVKSMTQRRGRSRFGCITIRSQRAALSPIATSSTMRISA